MSGHTPGPWKVFTTTDGRKVVGVGEMTGDGITDCGFGVWRQGSDECLANARLIAAAPDLLAALLAYHEHFGPLEDNIMLNEDCRNCAQLARAAIAKASP